MSDAKPPADAPKCMAPEWCGVRQEDKRRIRWFCSSACRDAAKPPAPTCDGDPHVPGCIAATAPAPVEQPATVQEDRERCAALVAAYLRRVREGGRPSGALLLVAIRGGETASPAPAPVEPRTPGVRWSVRMRQANVMSLFVDAMVESEREIAELRAKLAEATKPHVPASDVRALLIEALQKNEASGVLLLWRDAYWLTDYLLAHPVLGPLLLRGGR